MDKLRFKNAVDSINRQGISEKGIGTLKEKTLHCVLKLYFEPDTGKHEIAVGRFVADIKNEKGITEIQTRQFNKLLKKLEFFLEFSDVTVVYPIAVEKEVCWLDTENGEISDKRKSPRPMKLYDALEELYKIKYTLDNPKMKVCLCMIKALDIRYLNGRSKDRKRGSTRCERIPIELKNEIYLENYEDYKIFLPPDLPHEFTSKDYAKVCRVKKTQASTALNVLRYMNVIEITGKSGRSIVYKKS